MKIDNEKQLTFCPSKDAEWHKLRRRIDQEYQLTEIMLLIMAGSYLGAGIYLLTLIF